LIQPPLSRHERYGVLSAGGSSLPPLGLAWLAAVVRRDGHSVAILDANGQLLCQGTKSLPVFMGTAPVTLQHFLTRYPPETLRPGDVLISNDPWIGTGHLFDINVMRPVFIEQEIVGYTMSITHLPDIGGLGFGASATEIYHEGLRIPIVKLLDAGVRNELVVEFISNNVQYKI